MRIIPLLDRNDITQDTLGVLHHWSGYVPEFIVVATPEHFPKIRERCCAQGIKPILGLKTWPLFNGAPFDDGEAWASMGDLLRNCTNAGDTVWLDHETAIEPHTKDGWPFNHLDLLAQIRAQLPKNRQYLWWPSVYGATRDERRPFLQITACVFGALRESVTFVSCRYDGPDSVERVWSRLNHEILCGFADAVPHAIAHIGRFPAKIFWAGTSCDVGQVARLIREDSTTDAMIFHPHFLEWPSVTYLRDTIKLLVEADSGLDAPAGETVNST